MLKAGEICGIGRVRTGGERTRESFCCIKIPKGTIIAPGISGSKL